MINIFHQFFAKPLFSHNIFLFCNKRMFEIYLRSSWKHFLSYDIILNIIQNWRYLIYKNHNEYFFFLQFTESKHCYFGIFKSLNLRKQVVILCDSRQTVATAGYIITTCLAQHVCYLLYQSAQQIIHMAVFIYIFSKSNIYIELHFTLLTHISYSETKHKIKYILICYGIYIICW